MLKIVVTIMYITASTRQFGRRYQYKAMSVDICYVLNNTNFEQWSNNCSN